MNGGEVSMRVHSSVYIMCERERGAHTHTYNGAQSRLVYSDQISVSSMALMASVCMFVSMRYA